jgi:hypothetical protein
MAFPNLWTSSRQATMGILDLLGDVSPTQLLCELASITDPYGLFRTHPTFHTEIGEDLADVRDLGIEIEAVELFGPYLVHTAHPYKGLQELNQ